MGVINVIEGSYNPHVCILPSPNDHKIGTLLQCDVCYHWWMNCDYSFVANQECLWCRVRWYNFKARARIREHIYDTFMNGLHQDLEDAVREHKLWTERVDTLTKNIDELSKPSKFKE